MQLVEEKYSTERRAHAHLDQSIRQAIDKRQQAKQDLLAHERTAHAKGGDCSVCGGTGKVKQGKPEAYVICAACGGSGITRFNETGSSQ